MMILDCVTQRYALYYDRHQGIGYVERSRDGAKTHLVTGRNMMQLRRNLNRARTNATAKRKLYRPFDEIAELILGDYFPLER